MNHQHHRHDKSSFTPDRHVRCLRHSVWMAVCDDCRAAHAALVSGPTKRSAAAG